jgi:hypothetical protein
LGYLPALEQDGLLMETQQLGRIINGLIGSLKPEARATVPRQLTTEN